MSITRREALRLFAVGAAGAAVFGSVVRKEGGEARLVSNEDKDQVMPVKPENVIYPEGAEKVEIDGEEVTVLSLQKMLENDLRIVFDRKSNSFNLGNSKAGDESVKGVVTNFGPIKLSYQTLRLDGSVDRNSPSNWKVFDREGRLIARRPVFYLTQ